MVFGGKPEMDGRRHSCHWTVGVEFTASRFQFIRLQDLKHEGRARSAGLRLVKNYGGQHYSTTALSKDASPALRSYIYITEALLPCDGYFGLLAGSIVPLRLHRGCFRTK